MIADDPSSRDALAPHLEMVNQIGQTRIAAEERRAERRESSPKSSHPSVRSGKREAVKVPRDSSRSSKHSSRKQSSNMGASAARVTVAETKPLS